MAGYISLIAENLRIPLWFLIIILLWEGVWKLVALWKAARKGSVTWFVILALLNTAGILPILYIFIFSKMKFTEVKRKRRKLKRKR